MRSHDMVRALPTTCTPESGDTGCHGHAGRQAVSQRSGATAGVAVLQTVRANRIAWGMATQERRRDSKGRSERGHGTRNRGFTALTAWFILLLSVPAALALDPIPAEKRVPAAIARVIEAPKDQPMHMPTDVAVDKAGHVYVADGANNRVLKFNADGTLDEAITAPDNQKLNRPVGVTVDPNNELWIADTGNHRMLVVNADATKAMPVAPIGIENPSAFSPTDMVITPDGKRTYAVDNHNHRLLIRDNAAKKWVAMGTSGRSLGQFQWPFMVCLGADNYVYVSEAIGSRVQRISPADRWAGEVGRWGVELGQFYRPKGVAIDARGRLYVSDSTLNVIQVFNDRGGVEGVLTDKEGLPLRFQHPMGMCFDAKGHLYVVELKANRVAVVALGAGKQ